MDTFVEECYIVEYETARNTPSIGATTASGHTLARIWPQLPFSCRSSTLIAEFGRTMAPVVPETRTEGLTCQSKSRSAAIAGHGTEADVSTDLVAWTTCCWLLDRSLDSSPGLRFDRQGIWDSVFTCQLLEADECLGVELSEAQKARQKKGRTSDPDLEAVGLVTYRKTLRLTEPIWFFRTRVDSSWCPRSFASIATSCPNAPKQRCESFIRLGATLLMVVLGLNQFG